MMPHEQDIRNYLLSHLPPYMVPSRIHSLMDFPRNTAGKVDRKELLEISRMESVGFRPFILPRTESEEQVSAIWKKVLESEEDISVVESFFDMGGDSMKLVKLRQGLEELAGVEIKVARLFELHTIEAIATWLDEREGSQKESTEIVSF
jgi:acyl carrier protein